MGDEVETTTETALRRAAERFDAMLAARASPLEQVDAVLCEDGATAMIYGHLLDGDSVCICMDLTESDADTFNPVAYVCHFLAGCKSLAARRLRRVMSPAPGLH